MTDETLKQIIIDELLASEYQDNYTYTDIANSIVYKIREIESKAS